MEVYDPYIDRFVDMIGTLIQDQKDTIDILEAALRLYRDFVNEVQFITESVDCYDMDRDLEAALSDLDEGLKAVENKYVSDDVAKSAHSTYDNIDISKLNENKISINGKEYELIESLSRVCETCRYYHVAWDGRVVPNEDCCFCINYDPNNPYATLMWKRKD